MKLLSKITMKNERLSIYDLFAARLQSNLKGVPKWEPRSRLGIYVGHSPAHVGSVGLVLNLKTGLV